MDDRTRPGNTLRDALIWSAGLWALFTVVGLLVRPLFPVDETRYLTVAWEMHLTGDWLVPTLNFEPYHHKPPLMFWAINVFWALLGVGRAAAALVPFGFAFATLAAAGWLAAHLWPDRARRVAPFTVLIGVGSLPFLVYGTLFLFDYMLAAFVAVALTALWRFAAGGRAADMALFGLALGAGVLAKGPVALVHVIFPVLLAPVWMRALPARAAMGWARWYLSCALGIGLGAAVALCWAIPAGLHGGEEYRSMIFWGQSAGRMVRAFDHEHPFWFYLPFLPLFGVPWLLWPRLWRAAAALRARPWSAPALFLACWILPVLAAFMAISGKQVHYLVPLTPALWAALAFAWDRSFPDAESSWAAMTAPLKKTALALAALLALGQAAAGASVFRLYDLTPLAEAVQPWLGRPIAFVQNWHGELGFLARMTGPVSSLPDKKHLSGWFEDHPDGIAIVRRRDPIDSGKYDLLFDMPFKGRRHYSIVAPRAAHLGEAPDAAPAQ